MQNRASAQPLLLGKHSASLKVVLASSLALSLSACTMNETAQRTGSGAAIGALGGALLGGSREGAAIGAAVGAAGGYMVDQYKKRGDADAEAARLRAENEKLREQAGQ